MTAVRPLPIITTVKNDFSNSNCNIQNRGCSQQRILLRQTAGHETRKPVFKGPGTSSSVAMHDPNNMDEEADTLEKLEPAGLKRGKEGLPVHPHYTKVGESFRKNVPHEMQCSMFCGGRKCKYENGDTWRDDQMAIKGIYSHWVTDNLLAMARPNTGLIKKAGLTEEFKKQGIKSIFNLQIPGEHASCGQKLEDSGFTYDPNDLMTNDIYFYNFAWKDYREASMAGLLDMVKVLSFALSEGKVAVHCHAGLGRTGVLMACYLVYFMRVRSNDAIRYVRLKRPGSVQTRRQIDCVKEFEAYFLPQCLIFSSKPPKDPDRRGGRFSIESHLKRQKHVLHGFEARSLKHIPKLMFTLCERLLRLTGCNPTYAADSEENFTKQFVASNFDNKGTKLLNYKDGASADTSISSTPSYSMAATRRSSQSMLLSTDDEGGSMGDLPAGGGGGNGGNRTRPSSETQSYLQSCSSALSEVDTERLDKILDDGIQGQTLNENRVVKELASHADLQRAAQSEVLPKHTVDKVYAEFLVNHDEVLRKEGGSKAQGNVRLFQEYRKALNFKLSAWDRLQTETELFVLTSLLLEWMEHLKNPILDRDGIVDVVIHCDNIDAALKKLPNHVCYILEYLVRFVARLQPLKREESENLMRRLMAALTHQSIVIDDKTYPSKKNFPKLRGGTGDSTLKFMMKLFDLIVQPNMIDKLNSYKRMQMSSVSGYSTSLDQSTSSSIANNHSSIGSSSAESIQARTGASTAHSGRRHHHSHPERLSKTSINSMSSMEVEFSTNSVTESPTAGGGGSGSRSVSRAASRNGSVLKMSIHKPNLKMGFRDSAPVELSLTDPEDEQEEEDEDVDEGDGGRVKGEGEQEQEEEDQSSGDEFDRLHREFNTSTTTFGSKRPTRNHQVDAIIHTVPIVRNGNAQKNSEDDSFEFGEEADSIIDKLEAEFDS